MGNRIISCMKTLKVTNLKTIALTKAMYTAIGRYEDQAFDDMSEENEKNILNALSLDTIAACSKSRHY